MARKREGEREREEREKEKLEPDGMNESKRDYSVLHVRTQPQNGGIGETFLAPSFTILNGFN